MEQNKKTLMLNSNLNKIIFIFICLLFFESRHVKAQSVAICQGDSAVLRMNCSYLGTLQWQNSPDQLTWSIISGATFDTLKVIPSNITYYRAAIASGTCNLVYSDTAVITVNLIPPAPSILIVDTCGSSRLTATSYSGTLLWNTGQTVNSITVSSAGAYTLTQIVNGCSSLMGSATASPITIPLAPTVVVIDNCGSSTLTANGFAGTLLWSNAQTINPISVNSAGIYTVSQTVNGCISAAGSGTASPTVIPSTANAGSDINLTCGVNITTLAGNTPIIGTGAWSIVSGTATITNPGSPTSGVTGLIEPGLVTLRWTISNAPCTSSVDDVIITVNSIPLAPTAGTATPTKTVIVWNWNTVSGATGYKFNTVNNYSTATDNLGNLSYTQTGLTCNTLYSLYIWAYNGCGNSSVTTLTQTTASCCVTNAGEACDKGVTQLQPGCDANYGCAAFWGIYYGNNVGDCNGANSSSFVEYVGPYCTYVGFAYYDPFHYPQPPNGSCFDSSAAGYGGGGSPGTFSKVIPGTGCTHYVHVADIGSVQCDGSCQ